jgi:hypothetical protein
MTVLNSRLGGVAAVLSGLLLFLGASLQLFETNPLGQGLYYAAFICMPFALMALYGAQARQSGLLGLAAFVTLLLGSLSEVSMQLLPLLELAGSKEAHQALMFTFVAFPIIPAASALTLIGGLLFGAATLYAGVFPRWAGLLLILGILVLLPAELIYPWHLLWSIATLLYGTGLGWMGVSMWRPGLPAYSGMASTQPG